MERRLAAILAGDMVGYSRLMAIDEATTLARLKELRQNLIAPAIASRGGEIVKLTGDGFFALFSSVVSAVEAGAAIQEAVATSQAASKPETRIAFRMGLHLGDIMLDDDDIYGDDVNIAARLEAQAEPGGVLLSDAAHAQVRGKTKCVFVPVGPIKLKNIPEPVNVHKLSLGPAVPSAFEAFKGHKPEIPEKPSIAVLPFDNMSADPAQAYFADGITEDIITELSRFPGLMVIARNSTFAFRGRSADLREVSRDLGARFIVEGSVRRASNRIRVSAQLIDAPTGRNIWAERYDRDLQDIFEVQEDITARVVASIAPQIERAEIERARSYRGMSVTSYDIALKAQARMEDAFVLGSSEALFEAIDIAGIALERDARCTRALWVQGRCHAYAWLYRWGSAPQDELLTGWQAIERLFAIDRSDPAAWSLRGMVRHFRGDHDGAIADLHRAIEITPNNASALFMLGWAASLEGQPKVARAHVERGLRISPRDNDVNLGIAYLALAQASFAEADFSDTRKWGRLAVQMTPHAPIRRALMVASAAFAGAQEEADEHRKALASFAPDFIASIIAGRITLYNTSGHNDRLVKGLELATSGT